MKDIMKMIVVFIFILFAALSIDIVNAVTIFEPCTYDYNAYPLTVTIKPDPLVPGENSVFEVSGSLSKATSNADLVVEIGDTNERLIVKPFTVDICVVNNGCPVTYINAEIGNVFVPSVLPKPYVLSVFVSERTASSAKEALACAVALVR